MINRRLSGVKRGFWPEKNPIRATAAKEAGQGMSTEETAVRPDQKLYKLVVLLASISATWSISFSGSSPQWKPVSSWYPTGIRNMVVQPNEQPVRLEHWDFSSAAVDARFNLAVASGLTFFSNVFPPKLM